MTLLRAIVLGVVQGVTEFVPVSSKSHLVVVPALLGWPAPSLPFVVLLHLGSLVALAVYFARDVVAILRAERGTIGLLVIASLPAAIVGLLFEETFERLLSRPRQVAVSMLATSAILVGAEWAAGTIGRKRLPRPLGERPGTRDAALMGVAQAVALLPGISRSGITMGAGLAGGMARAAAARFSFLMALVAIAGANALELPEVARGGFGSPEIAGLAASAVSSYLVIGGLLRFLRRNNFLPFAAWCALVAIAGLILL